MLRFFRSVLVWLIVACSLPLLAIALLIDLLFSARFVFLPRSGARSREAGFALQRRWKADEFHFQAAIPSYEDLIDEFAGRRR